MGGGDESNRAYLPVFLVRDLTDLSCLLSLANDLWAKDVLDSLSSRINNLVKVWEISMRTELNNKHVVDKMFSLMPGMDVMWASLCSYPTAKTRTSAIEVEQLEESLQILEGMFLRLFARGEDFQRAKQADVDKLVYAVAVSAVAVLALVYLYLVGAIDRGGTRTFSPGSRLFSSTFVSIVLVLAFYVWFKSRAAPRQRCCTAPRVGYRRHGGGKPVARYKPPGASGNCDNIYLRVCDTDEGAGIMKEIAAFYYGQHPNWLYIEDLPVPYFIPPTPSEQANLSTEEKRKWVVTQVREVYKGIGRFRAGIAHLEQNGTLGHHLPNPPVEQVEHDPSVAFNPDFRVEDMDQNVPDNPEAMIYFPYCSAAETEPVLDNHVAEAVIMSDNLGDVCFGYEAGTSWVSAVNNAVHGMHSEVGVGGLENGGAAHDTPLSTSCEVPSTLRPSRESPTDFWFFKQHSAPMAGLSNVDEPQKSTSDLSPFAMKLVSFLVQQVEEKNSLNEEQARMIVELKREVELLRSISQY